MRPINRDDDREVAAAQKLARMVKLSLADVLDHGLIVVAEGSVRISVAGIYYSVRVGDP